MGAEYELDPNRRSRKGRQGHPTTDLPPNPCTPSSRGGADPTLGPGLPGMVPPSQTAPRKALDFTVSTREKTEKPVPDGGPRG